MSIFNLKLLLNRLNKCTVKNNRDTKPVGTRFPVLRAKPIRRYMPIVFSYIYQKTESI